VPRSTGTWSGEGEASCQECQAGKVSVAGSASCESECGGGTYAGAGEATCLPCPAGQFSSSGAEKCENCIAGKFSVERSHACADCNPGKHSGVGAPDCTACDATAGFVAPESGMETCDYCGPGKRADSSSNACVPCAASTYSLGGSHKCAPCQAQGTFSPSGAATCTLARPGHKANGERTGEFACEAGTYSTGSVDSCASCGTGFSNEGASKCDFCGPGEYMHEQATIKECSDCEAGKYSETGASSAEGCFACGVGEYSSEGAGFCSAVRAGEEVAKDGELRIGAASCTAGRYSTGSVDSCTSCGTGFSNDGASKCEFCGPGKYMHEEAMTKECLGCVAGKFSATGSNSIAGCTMCDLGFVSDAGESAIHLPLHYKIQTNCTPSRRIGLLHRLQPRQESV
jgi:hypothetical protein